MKKLAVLWAASAIGLAAQTLTLTESTTVQAAPPRIGFNMATSAPYGPGQYYKNLLYPNNPGMEGWIDSQIVQCASGTTTSCTGVNIYDTTPSGFFVGGTFTFWVAGTNGTGAAQGCTGTITSYTAANYGTSTGAIFGWSTPCSAAIQNDDYISVSLSGAQSTISSSTGGYAGNWNVTLSSSATLGMESTDLPSGNGHYAFKVTSPNGSASATLANIMDATVSGAGNAVLINGGTWTYSVQMKNTSCTSTCTFSMQVQRFGGFSSTATTCTPTVNATAGAGWTTCSGTVAPNETTAAVNGSIQFAISTTGQGVFLFKNASFSQTSGTNVSNTTPYRDVIVSAVQTLKPGSLRLWDGTGDSLDNWITPIDGRQQAFGFQTSAPPSVAGGGNGTEPGLYEFLQLCQYVGADPWHILPTWWSPTQAKNLVEFLTGASGTTYGNKRIALGQSASYATVFVKIHIELGNETWNSAFPGENMPQTSDGLYTTRYGELNKLIFAAMKTVTSYSSSSYDFIMGCQQASSFACMYAHNADTTGHDSISLSGYNPGGTSGPLNDVSSAANEYKPQFAEAWGIANDATNGNDVLYTAAIAATSRVVPINTYEFGEGTTTASGTVTIAQLDTNDSSMGSGLSAVLSAMERTRNYGMVQEEFTFGQFNFGVSCPPAGGSSCTVPLWGLSIDYGGSANRLRPVYLTEQVANACNIGTMYGASWASNPTFTGTATNGHYAFSNVPTLYAYPFKSGLNRCILLINSDTSTSRTITWAGIVPTGSATETKISPSSINSTNESSTNVSIATTGITLGSTYTIPPYSVVALSFGTATTGNPTTINSGIFLQGGTTIQ